MATLGNFTWFDQALDKEANGTINLAGTNFKAVLTTDAQVLSKSFSGASTHCRYADLTSEVATGNGYTVGGLSLTSVALSRSGSVVKWTADPWSWTLTGTGIADFKYCVIFDNAAANKDLLCFVDMDTSGGFVLGLAGTVLFTPSGGGILTWSQP